MADQAEVSTLPTPAAEPAPAQGAGAAPPAGHLPGACPSCGARLLDTAAAWCSLCFARLDAPTPAAVPPSAPAGVQEAPAAATPTATGEPDTVSALLAQLSATESTRLGGPLAHLPASGAARGAVVLAGALAVTVAVLALMALLGALVLP